jgi:hypothetical protein
MKDKAIVTGNFDGGVYVGKGGTFIMEGGMVWGNTGRSVNVDGGTFINQGGRYDG